MNCPTYFVDKKITNHSLDGSLLSWFLEWQHILLGLKENQNLLFLLDVETWVPQREHWVSFGTFYLISTVFKSLYTHKEV